jgi:cell division protein FtsB
MNQEETEAMAEELDRYTAEWVRRTQGDPDERAANYELSPEEYAQWQMLNAPLIMVGDEVSQLEQRISQYAAEWARRNVGDPANYEMTPEEYAQWRMLQAPSIMNADDVEDLNEDIEAYVQEWARRHLGEGEAAGKAGELYGPQLP